jgi:multidrug resistance protein, MATE family
MAIAGADKPIPLQLPGQITDSVGRTRVDWKLVLALAGPFMANSAVQAVLNLTDTWFIGRISTQALSAIASIHWIVLVCIMLLGGVGLAVQTIVAQAYGGRRRLRAAQATWTALWAAAMTAPIFIALAYGGTPLVSLFDLDPVISALAVEYWFPRLAGASLGVALWAILGFFNGIARPQVTLYVNIFVAVLNAVLNQWFIVELDMGIAGSAWATTTALGCGVVTALCLFLGPRVHREFRSRLTWHLHPARLLNQLQLGFPMGVLIAADLIGFAMFQLMEVRLGPVDGAATQIAMMLTSIAYMPGVGIAMTGTTLVGQAIGADDREWARRIGNYIIALCTGYMAFVGVAIAACGPWLVPSFVPADDPLAADVVRTGTTILWIAAAYQLFDGLNFGSSFCLRGAGDALIPAAMVLALSWLIFVPLAHMLTFQPGQGWVEWLPQFGLGAIGGWIAAVLYIVALGVAMYLRWHSGAWRNITIR